MNVRLIQATTQLIRIVCTLHAKAVARRRAELKAKVKQAADRAKAARAHYYTCGHQHNDACLTLDHFEAEAGKPISLEIIVK